MLSFIIYHETGVGNYKEMLETKPLLKDWIFQILKYDQVYFNDEGEHWCKHKESLPSQINSKMFEFFTDNCNRSKKDVLQFLEEINYNKTVLLKFSFPGNQH